jgi:hypothetical protein
VSASPCSGFSAISARAGTLAASCLLEEEGMRGGGQHERHSSVTQRLQIQEDSRLRERERSAGYLRFQFVDFGRVVSSDSGFIAVGELVQKLFDLCHDC